MRLFALGFVAGAALAPMAAAAAPTQLYGKSVAVSWTETRSQRAVGQEPAFGSCTAQVIGAKQSGSKPVMLRSIASGATIEVESVSAGAASCSVAQGNPFAN